MASTTSGRGGGAYLSQTGDVQAFPVLHGGFAGFAGPRSLPLAVGEPGPGEDVVVGQVQVCGVHGELADELQQAGQAVEQPLQARTHTHTHGQKPVRPRGMCPTDPPGLTTVQDSWSSGSRMPELKISRSSCRPPDETNWRRQTRGQWADGRRPWLKGGRWVGGGFSVRWTRYLAAPGVLAVLDLILAGVVGVRIQVAVAALQRWGKIQRQDRNVAV